MDRLILQGGDLSSAGVTDIFGRRQIRLYIADGRVFYTNPLRRCFVALGIDDVFGTCMGLQGFLSETADGAAEDSTEPPTVTLLGTAWAQAPAQQLP